MLTRSNHLMTHRKGGIFPVKTTGKFNQPTAIRLPLLKRLTQNHAMSSFKFPLFKDTSDQPEFARQNESTLLCLSRFQQSRRRKREPRYSSYFIRDLVQIHARETGVDPRPSLRETQKTAQITLVLFLSTVNWLSQRGRLASQSSSFVLKSPSPK